MKKFLLICLFAGSSVKAFCDVDIHTGCRLTSDSQPSTGLNTPQDFWAQDFIYSLKNNSYSKFKELLDEAVHNNPGHFPLFEFNELLNVLFSHKLGDGRTLFDIAKESSDSQIKEDMNILKALLNKNPITILDEIKKCLNLKK